MQVSRAPSLPVAGPFGNALAIGIDVGGTKIAGAIVDLATGAIHSRRQIATDFDRGGEAVLSDVRGMALTLNAEAEARGEAALGLGLGVAELVSPEGMVFSDYRIAWKGTDVQARLSADLPVRLESDVRAAAYAEGLYGAGGSFRDFIYVTIGTGIAAVSVRDGVPYAGARGAALVMANGAFRHTCSRCGHETIEVVEDIASGPAIAGAWRPGSRGEDVLAAAAQGDQAALKVIDHAGEALGNVIALLVNSLDPAAVIVGGGLGSAPGAYWQALEIAIRKGLWSGDQRDLPILQAALGPDAGLIGAAATLARHLAQPQEERGRLPA